MSELGLDVITGPFKRLVCRIRGHRPISGSAWQGSMACGRCGLGVRVRCSCRWARPSERDLTGHRHNCPFHPPEGWPFGQPVARAEVTQDEHGVLVKFVPFRAEQPKPERQLVLDPDGRLWLLDGGGRVEREVSREELRSWASYEDPPAELGPGGTWVVLPSRYRGIPYRITRVDWTEFEERGGNR